MSHLACITRLPRGYWIDRTDSSAARRTARRVVPPTRWCGSRGAPHSTTAGHDEEDDQAAQRAPQQGSQRASSLAASRTAGSSGEPCAPRARLPKRVRPFAFAAQGEGEAGGEGRRPRVPARARGHVPRKGPLQLDQAEACARARLGRRRSPPTPLLAPPTRHARRDRARRPTLRVLAAAGKEKAGKWNVPIPKVRPVGDDDEWTSSGQLSLCYGTLGPRRFLRWRTSRASEACPARAPT